MFFWPRVVERKTSKVNGEIVAYVNLGKYSLSVDNLTQSGGLLNSIWKKALMQASRYTLTPSRCLILGLGGGTAARWVQTYWPAITITAIEIDPVMIEMGKKYGELNNIKNLKIITADAFKAIYKLPARNALPEAAAPLQAGAHSAAGGKAGIYDLILVDTYQGKTYPLAARSKKTAAQLKKLLAPKGILIFNRLNWGEFGQDTDKHIQKLKTVFPSVWAHKILSNTLVFCHNSR